MGGKDLNACQRGAGIFERAAALRLLVGMPRHRNGGSPASLMLIPVS